MAQQKELPLEAREFKDSSGKTLLYRLLSPKESKPSTKVPLVLFLHGAGERGKDNAKQLVHGVAEFVKRLEQNPCYLIAPQCPENVKWVDCDWSADKHALPEKPTEPMRLALELVESLPKVLPIDLQRIYVTGLSMGGYGTWDALCRQPTLFAAGVPVCGGGDEAQAAKIAKLPIWAFHGAKDTAVKPLRSRNMIAALEKAGGKPKYTEYPNEGHASWNPAYGDNDLHAWLFAQKRA